MEKRARPWAEETVGSFRDSPTLRQKKIQLSVVSYFVVVLRLSECSHFLGELVSWWWEALYAVVGLWLTGELVVVRFLKPLQGSWFQEFTGLGQTCRMLSEKQGRGRVWHTQMERQWTMALVLRIPASSFDCVTPGMLSSFGVCKWSKFCRREMTCPKPCNHWMGMGN